MADGQEQPTDVGTILGALGLTPEQIFSLTGGKTSVVPDRRLPDIRWVNGYEQVYAPTLNPTTGQYDGPAKWQSTGRYDPIRDPAQPPNTTTATGYVWKWTDDQWVQQPSTSSSAGQQALQPYTAPGGQEQFTDANGRVWTWTVDPNTGRGDYVITGFDPSRVYNPETGQFGAGAAGLSEADRQALEIQRQRLGLEQQQQAWQQQYQGQQLAQQQQNYLANLRANPASWLEYSLAAGQTPVVQPWMLPLSPQEYGLQAGMAIPGWKGLPQSAQPQPTTTPPATTGGGTTQPPTTGGGVGTSPAGTPSTNVPGVILGGAFSPTGGMMSDADVERLALLNRQVMAGSTGAAAPLTPEQQSVLQTNAPGSWQAWLAQGGQPATGSGGFYTPNQPPPQPTQGQTSIQQQSPAPQPVTQQPPAREPAPDPLAGMTDQQIAAFLGLPYMQTGGLVTKPTLALIGEAGPEAVVPLSNQNQMLPIGEPWAPSAPAPNTAEQAPAAPSGYQSTYPQLQEGQLPWLMNPATQYWARMGPTAQQQLLGYEQMRTGIRPEEYQWRLWSMAPPSGANPGIRYRR